MGIYNVGRSGGTEYNNGVTKRADKTEVASPSNPLAQGSNDSVEINGGMIMMGTDQTSRGDETSTTPGVGYTDSTSGATLVSGDGFSEATGQDKNGDPVGRNSNYKDGKLTMRIESDALDSQSLSLAIYRHDDDDNGKYGQQHAKTLNLSPDMLAGIKNQINTKGAAYIEVEIGDDLAADIEAEREANPNADCDARYQVDLVKEGGIPDRLEGVYFGDRKVAWQDEITAEGECKMPPPPCEETPPPVAQPPVEQPPTDNPPEMIPPITVEAPPTPAPPPPAKDRNGGAILGDPLVYDDAGNLVASFTAPKEALWDSKNIKIVSNQEPVTGTDDEATINTLNQQISDLQGQMDPHAAVQKEVDAAAAALAADPNNADLKSKYNDAVWKQADVGSMLSALTDDQKAAKQAQIDSLQGELVEAKKKLAENTVITSLEVNGEHITADQILAEQEAGNGPRVFTDTSADGTATVTMTATARVNAAGQTVIEFGDHNDASVDGFEAIFTSTDGNNPAMSAEEAQKLMTDFSSNGTVNSVMLAELTGNHALISNGQFDIKG